MSSEPLRPELILLLGLLALVAGFVAVILVVSLATAVI